MSDDKKDDKPFGLGDAGDDKPTESEAKEKAEEKSEEGCEFC